MTKFKGKINAEFPFFFILAAFIVLKYIFGHYCQYNSTPLSNCQKPQVGFRTNLILVFQHLIPKKLHLIKKLTLHTPVKTHVLVLNHYLHVAGFISTR